MRSVLRCLAVALLLALALLSGSPAGAQSPPLRPVTVGSPMPDFNLPVFQGGEVTLSKLLGKNVMIVFPRGLSRPDAWCHVCPYQHAELADYDARTGFRARANLEILFVLPYDREVIARWLDAYPQLLQDNEDAKNPSNPSALDDAGRARMERSRAAYCHSIKLFILLSSQVFLSLGGFSFGRFFFGQCQEDT
ncbi:MAG: redoxin domain-containing protein, partial [Candidatus Bipolaricaulota bacterium]